MNTSELQIQLLNRQFTNIELYKSLRTKLPITIGGLIIAITGLLLKIEENKILENDVRILFILVICIIGIGSMLAYFNIQKVYNHFAGNIYYLYDKLGIKGSDYFAEGKEPNKDKNRAKNIFLIGYISITLITILCSLILFSY